MTAAAFAAAPAAGGDVFPAILIANLSMDRETLWPPNHKMVPVNVQVDAKALPGLEEADAAYKRVDYETALRELRPLANQGNAEAQYNLGVVYDKGLGVPRDYTEAAKWFRKAAVQGNAGAQFALGFMYGHGEGVRQNYAEAVKWYRKAAEQGVARAQNNLGVMYGQGQGVARDLVRAYMWCSLSAAQGHKNAANLCDAVAKRMTPAQIAEAQRMAREWKTTKE